MASTSTLTAQRPRGPFVQLQFGSQPSAQHDAARRPLNEGATAGRAGGNVEGFGSRTSPTTGGRSNNNWEGVGRVNSSERWPAAVSGGSTWQGRTSPSTQGTQNNWQRYASPALTADGQAPLSPRSAADGKEATRTLPAVTRAAGTRAALMVAADGTLPRLAPAGHTTAAVRDPPWN